MSVWPIVLICIHMFVFGFVIGKLLYDDNGHRELSAEDELFRAEERFRDSLLDDNSCLSSAEHSSSSQQ